MPKQLDKLNYSQKKKFLANFDDPDIVYNALYRVRLYEQLYSFDRESNYKNTIDDFIDTNTLEGTKLKEITQKSADWEYEGADAQYDAWKLEQKLFNAKYGDHFSTEERHTMKKIFTNAENMETVYQLFINNFRKGKQVEANPQEALKNKEEVSKEQQKLIEKLNKKFKVTDDLSYENYTYNQDDL